MLEKPAIPDDKILASIQEEYGFRAAQFTFLPLGADLNTAVYRLVTGDGRTYFVKLRRGFFDEISVALPKFYSDQGIRQILAPLATLTGQLRADLDGSKLILYPFIEGQNGYERELSAQLWIDLGAGLKHIHTTSVPKHLKKCIKKEAYSPRGREIVKEFLRTIDNHSYDDPTAAKLAEFLIEKRNEIHALIKRTERLALTLFSHPREFIVCHSDIHAGNVLIDGNSNLYIVDWDDPILAPKERDLMAIGGCQFGMKHTPQDEEIPFYRGYGQMQLDPVALAYYRYERIIQDIAVYCEQLLLSDEGSEDREQSLIYLESNFLPNGTIEVTCQSDRAPKDI